ncbi:MAG: cell division protein FtsZ, partial [Polaromonas sp.]|nr:cell division protein FtsZ [Polaromonas sp.]
MSTLQISLAIIGGLVLAGVVAYNAWVTRKSVPRLARERSAHSPDDATSDETVPYSPEDLTGHEIQRIDPVLGDMPGASVQPDPAAIAAAAAAVSVNPLLHQPERKPSLDALIDVITPLVLDHEVSGDALLAALPGTRRVGSKPFAVEGLCEATGEWETPRLGQRYRALQAGVQLANRAGALNDIE